MNIILALSLCLSASLIDASPTKNGADSTVPAHFSEKNGIPKGASISQRRSSYLSVAAYNYATTYIPSVYSSSEHDLDITYDSTGTTVTSYESKTWTLSQALTATNGYGTYRTLIVNVYSSRGGDVTTNFHNYYGAWNSAGTWNPSTWYGTSKTFTYCGIPDGSYSVGVTASSPDFSNANEATYRIQAYVLVNDLVCLNGGTKDTCGTGCTCSGDWTGTTCETCGLSSTYCQNGGILDTTTCSCVCTQTCGSTAGLQNVTTVGGNQCSFPFEYGGITYTRCIYGTSSDRFCKIHDGRTENCVIVPTTVTTLTQNHTSTSGTGNAATTTTYTCGVAPYSCNAQCVAFSAEGKNYAQGACSSTWAGAGFYPWCYTNTTTKAWGLCPQTAAQVETKTGYLCHFPFTYSSGSYLECTTDGNAQCSGRNSQWCYQSSGVTDWNDCLTSTGSTVNADCTCQCYGGRSGTFCTDCTRTAANCQAGSTFDATNCRCDCSGVTACASNQKMNWQCACEAATNNEDTAICAAPRLAALAAIPLIGLMLTLLTSMMD